MPIGFALATGFTAVLVGTAVASAVSRHNIAVRVAVVTVFVAVAAALIAGPTGAACTAEMGWLFTNGFLVNGRGDLAWRGTADLVRLAVFAAAASAGLGVVRAWQRRQSAIDGGWEDPPPPGHDLDPTGANFSTWLPWQPGRVSRVSGRWVPNGIGRQRND